MTNYKKDEEMSMEDILSSIRKYVADEKNTDSFDKHENGIVQDQYPSEQYDTQSREDNDDVITLGQEDVAEQSGGTGHISDDNIVLGNSTTDFNNLNAEDTTVGAYSGATDRNRESPFNKLAEALKTYGTRKKSTELSIKMSMEQFFRTVTENYLQKWMDANIKRAVDEIVRKEIEKLKQE